jgi:two-component system cell cycle response regulator
MMNMNTSDSNFPPSENPSSEFCVPSSGPDLPSSAFRVPRSDLPQSEVLVVEDSPTQAESYKALLEESGYRVCLAAHGGLALAAARLHRPALIISDVLMPEMDGHELCRQIRADPALADLPVLLLTQLNEPADIIRGLDCGADSFLIKSSGDDVQLLSRVEALLQDSRRSRLPSREPVIEVTFAKQRYRLASSRPQMLDLLLAQYEESQRQHRELLQTDGQLHEALQAIQALSQLIHDHAVQPNPRKVDKIVDLLIAEDSPTQAAALQGVLEEYGYLVHVAGNGRLALESVRQRKPALIISDVVMPEMDGFDFCRALKDDPALHDIPVILLTALTDPQDIVRGLTAKADYYLTKPFDPIHLLTRIEYLLAHPVKLTGRPQSLEAVIGGQNATVQSQPQQIMNLLLATYEQAVQQNRSLRLAQQELRDANEQLEQRVADRTLKLTAEIAERQRAEAERERLIVELKESLAQVKTLSGLLPICSGCKKIRDSDNYWHKVEAYIASHSKAKFTHGLCPECIKIYFPASEAP